MEPTIVYQDDTLLILNKPAGITVNRSDTTPHEKTVQDWVEEQFPGLNFRALPNSELDFHKRSGIVHRIDKETSGILVAAKTPEAFLALQKQFKERVVKKSYLALVHGKVEPTVGEINVPVGRLPWNRLRFGVVAGGREALTKYKVIANKFLVLGKASEPLTLLELYPETGRTHQIRVHLKHINRPIFSDLLYAGRKTMKQDRTLLSRMFLHAAKIQFQHPATGEMVSFESPLAAELDQFLRSLAAN